MTTLPDEAGAPAHIAHIIAGLSQGGAENALYRLVSVQPDPSKHLVFSLTDEGIFGPRLRALGVEVHCLGLRRGAIPSPLALLRLVRGLRQARPALVQTWMYHADLLGGVAARAAGIPVCWGIRHSDLSAQHNKWSTRLTAKACARLSRWIPTMAVSCSARAADVHRALGYKVPFEIVHNGLDVTAWRPQPSWRATVRSELGIGPEEFVLAHAGRSDPQKDHPTLAEAFARVHALRPQTRLLICGKGLARGDAYFDALPFTPRARMAVLALGPRDDLPRLWQAADAFTLSSALGEAFPNVVAEAMSCGLPCVVTDVGDAADIVGDTGRVVPPSDPAALAAAMLELCNMPPPERLQLGAAARHRVLEHFTLARMAAGFGRVWNDVMAGGKT
ncbi:hypothetical protein B1992_04110 [Pseudoxanthomonas broegbernensis]|uniref:Glycosyltransferase subfamily 4-like N-terminal domain-containing protein n=1 Tax=Pseudoxanthomonas broegbernensis TaxID=83619 RepID=A0A7V8GNK6_9GAMM|nr:glycosyltransferase [Pseudoxanthomonas broegbernensis]KAF1687180.1 hypothetical protein B1992_04110 [Pseudoxanthomonas broegbernensis]MBB6065839.1 glycosyltransferase involved in cell wall biosynthesis [Pseudoxanthomonas broegbernensis]